MGFADAGILRTAPIFAGKTQIKYADRCYHEDSMKVIYRKECSQLPSMYQLTCAFLWISGCQNVHRWGRVAPGADTILFILFSSTRSSMRHGALVHVNLQLMRISWEFHQS